MAKSKFSIEDAFKELEQLLNRMEDQELSLEESMTLYRKGVKLLDQCRKSLDKTEKEIQILQEGQNARGDEKTTPEEN